MMASTQASVTSTARRAASRGDGGPDRTNSSVMDLANNRLRLKFILQAAMEHYCSNFPAGQEVTSASWLPGMAGVRVKIGLKEGDEHVGSDRGGKKIGPAGLARLDRGQGT